MLWRSEAYNLYLNNDGRWEDGDGSKNLICVISFVDLMNMTDFRLDPGEILEIHGKINFEMDKDTTNITRTLKSCGVPVYGFSSKCPKCNSDHWSANYVQALKSENGDDLEYLERRCQFCGYHRYEETYEQSKEVKGGE